MKAKTCWPSLVCSNWSLFTMADTSSPSFGCWRSTNSRQRLGHNLCGTSSAHHGAFTPCWLGESPPETKMGSWSHHQTIGLDRREWVSSPFTMAHEHTNNHRTDPIFTWPHSAASPPPPSCHGSLTRKNSCGTPLLTGTVTGMIRPLPEKFVHANQFVVVRSRLAWTV